MEKTDIQLGVTNLECAEKITQLLPPAARPATHFPQATKGVKSYPDSPDFPELNSRKIKRFDCMLQSVRTHILIQWINHSSYLNYLGQFIDCLA